MSNQKPKITRTLIHGGKDSPVRRNFSNQKTTAEKVRFGEVCGKYIMIDRSKLPLPSGRFGKLILNTPNKKRPTVSSLCFESGVESIIKQSKAVSGFFCKERFNVTEEGVIEWL